MNSLGLDDLGDVRKVERHTIDHGDETTPLHGRSRKTKKPNYVLYGGILAAFILIIGAVLLIVHLGNSSDSGGGGGGDEVRDLVRWDINQTVYPDAQCNDGSDAVFYYRVSESKVNSTKWIIHINGGGNCIDLESCQERYDDTPNKMSSLGWEEDKPSVGIYSTNNETNPTYWDWNAVTIEYCTSDLWTGDHTPEQSGTEWSFKGKQIMNAFFPSLVDAGIDFDVATDVHVAGRAAGGMGTLVNWVDIVESLAVLTPDAAVVGIIDNAWSIDIDPLYPANCTHGEDGNFSCTTKDMVIIAQDLWGITLDSTCTSVYPLAGDEWWKCFYGLYAYPLATTATNVPVFVNSFLNNEAIYHTLGLHYYDTEAEIAYAVSVSDKLYEEWSTLGLTGYYSAGCPNHGCITNDDWATFNVEDVRLPDALNDWLLGFDVQLLENCTSFDPPLFCSDYCPPVV